MTTTQNSGGDRGFTLIEILLVVGALSVVATAGYMTATSVRETARETKLEKDVASLNSAITMYEASGGTNLAAAQSIPDVLGVLKTRADEVGTAKMNGVKGSFIDPRTTVVNQSSGEAASSQARAIWDATARRFKVAKSGSGVKEFDLDESAASAAIVRESRNITLAAADVNSGGPVWVWDHTGVTALSDSAGGVPSSPGGWTYTDSPATPAGPGEGGVSDPRTMMSAVITGPSSVNFLQAGGVMTGTSATQASLSLGVSGTAPAGVSLTLSGTLGTSSYSGPAPGSLLVTYAAFGNGSSATATAALSSNSSNIMVGAPVTKTISVTPLPLSLSITPASGTELATGGSITIAPSGAFPPNYLITYNTTGATVTSGTSVGGNVVIAAPASGSISVSASITGPSGYTQWFTAGSASASYTVAQQAGNQLPAGVLVAYATLHNSVQVRGNVVIAQQATQENLTMYGSSRIKGNLYLPGTPKVYKDHVAESQWDNQLWSEATDANFSNYILGMEYDENGVLANPGTPGWSPSPRVINLSGDPNPTNYRLLIQDSAKVEGKVYRRVTPPSLPTVTAPPAKANNQSRQYHSWTLDPTNPGRYSTTVDPNPPTNNPASFSLTTNATLTVKPGNYGTVTASNGGKLVLGDANNPNNVQYYSFESLQINGGATIEVVGKVVITMNYSSKNATMRIDNNGSFGNPDHPEYLQLNVYSSANPSQWTQQVLVASTSKFYGQINAPKGLVTIQENSMFKGSVTAYKLEMTGSAGANIEFNMSPIAE